MNERKGVLCTMITYNGQTKNLQNLADNHNSLHDTLTLFIE